MPKRLKQRWRPECVRGFRASARVRYDNGLALAITGNRSGAIYLWGYTAEMTLKAACFLLRLPDTEPITWRDHIRPAVERARSAYEIVWDSAGAGHNVRAWAELLVAERAALPATAFGPRIERVIQTYAQTVSLLWSESLRSHSNAAYWYEADQVQDAVEGLLAILDSKTKAADAAYPNRTRFGVICRTVAAGSKAGRRAEKRQTVWAAAHLREGVCRH